MSEDNGDLSPSNENTDVELLTQTPISSQYLTSQETYFNDANDYHYYYQRHNNDNDDNDFDHDSQTNATVAAYFATPCIAASKTSPTHRVTIKKRKAKAEQIALTDLSTTSSSDIESSQEKLDNSDDNHLLLPIINPPSKLYNVEKMTASSSTAVSFLHNYTLPSVPPTVHLDHASSSIVPGSSPLDCTAAAEAMLLLRERQD
ncbi:hypothetical protein BDF19DRAFT_420565 [Syncephalis fuscata]|nr:hypothetical protein BDF19DRAFT_420565 [Syncephalis fuscata]